MEESELPDVEELMQELEEEYAPREIPAPDVEELLRKLGPGAPDHARRDAAEQLGRVGTSSHRIVKALIAVCESDVHPEVNAAAAKALRTPVHQEYVQQHPDLLEATEGVLQDLRVLQRSRDERRRRPKISALDPASPLAPTELVLLHGDKFATTSTAAVKLGERVGLKLGEMVLATAFLAVEQAGAVQLEVRQQKALFGLLRLDKLYVVPGKHAISWPSRSFESQLHQIAASLQSKPGKGQNHISEIIYDWWMRREGRKCRSPWARLGDLVFDGLVYRGLLQKERKPGLRGLLTGASYVLPAETAALATQQSLEPVRELLATCRRTRPEVWDLLIKGINKGISKCEEGDRD